MVGGRFLDRLCVQADRALKALTPGVVQGERPYPASSLTQPLEPQQRQHVIGLMKINHAGEVCAQALYEGQALTAKTAGTSEAMMHAAKEEEDHLAWCEKRLANLDARPSLLNPIFYAGSFCMGAIAGAIGDRWSLGFVEETEKQVCAHLDAHLATLPPEDHETYDILMQMRQDEEEHGDAANALGAAPLPKPVQFGMACLSKVMTWSVYRL